MKVVIIDDEEQNNILLKNILEEYLSNEVEVIGIFTDSDEACKFILSRKPDLILIDIELNDTNAFKFLERLTSISFKIIFITAHANYAIKAIKYSAIDYLLKPINIEELITAIRKIENGNNLIEKAKIDSLSYNLQNSEHKNFRLCVSEKNSLHFIELNEIAYCEAKNNYTIIHCNSNKKYMLSKTLKYYEEILPTTTFLRVHNSFIVNIAVAQEFANDGKGGILMLKNGVKLEV